MDTRGEPVYCEIIDSNTYNIIAKGRVTDYKKFGGDKKRGKELKVDLISFDGKYYFHRKGNTRYYVTYKTAETIGTPIPYKEDETYRMKLWRDVEVTDADWVDVYRDFDMSELDDEIKDLVDVLNTIDGIRTTGSCSGHGKGEAWVAMNISKYSAAWFILRLLQHNPTHFYDRFEIDLGTPSVTVYEYNHRGDKDCPLCIKTKAIGNEAYLAINDLTRYIKELIAGNTFTLDDEIRTYHNNMGKRSFQWELWPMCNNLCKYCCTPDTKITMPDLTRKDIKDIQEGDTVLGVMAEDLDIGGRRFMLIPTTVLAVSKRPYTGKIYGGHFTDNHPMMTAQPFDNRYEQASTSTDRTRPRIPVIDTVFTNDYKCGYIDGVGSVSTGESNGRYKEFIKEAYDVPDKSGEDYCRGYLAGMYDEFGDLGGMDMYIVQSRSDEGDDAVLTEAERCCNVLNIRYEKDIDEKNNRKALHIDKDDVYTLISLMSPYYINMRYNDDSYRYDIEYDALPESDYDGLVYNIQTGSENYIADGYAVHNCYLGVENRHTDKARQIKSLNDCYDAISNLDFNLYNNISLIGGEFFQGQLDDPEVHDAFMAIMDKCCDYYSKGLIGSVWLTVTLTIGDQKHLYEVLDMFQERGCLPKPEYGASGLWLCTSWDAEGRFHTQKHADNWDFHMKNIHEKYPWVKFNCTIILMQKLIDMYNSGEWSPKRFMEEYHTYLFYKQCGLGLVNFADFGDETVPWTVKQEMAKQQQQKAFGFDFFPTRASFLKFLRKYAVEDADTFDRLFNIVYRADELHRNFNDKENDVANIRNKHSANESNAEQDQRFNKCGHILNYAPYIDSPKCCICDRDMIWNSIHGDEKR